MYITGKYRWTSSILGFNFIGLNAMYIIPIFYCTHLYYDRSIGPTLCYFKWQVKLGFIFFTQIYHWALLYLLLYIHNLLFYCRTLCTLEIYYGLITLCRSDINPSITIKPRLGTRFGLTMVKYALYNGKYRYMDKIGYTVRTLVIYITHSIVLVFIWIRIQLDLLW